MHEYLRALESGEPAGEGVRRQLVVVLTAYAGAHADAPAYARAALRYFPGDEALQRLAAGSTGR